MDSFATTSSWLKGSLLPPKPPPLGQAMTRMCAGRHLEDLGQRAVHVVGGLGRGPEGQLAVRPLRRHRRVLLQRKVGVPLEEERVLPDVIGLGEALLDRPKSKETSLCTLPCGP
jgi:hypothetical protein